MPLRTYYWNTRKVPKLRFYAERILKPRKMIFKHGNAGDIFNEDLIKFIYKTNPLNLNKEGNRLLMVGSIMNVLLEDDIINGIGWKGNDMSKKRDIIEKATVYGVRGPLTKSLFENYGTDLSNLKFEYDPGLLIKEVYNVNMEKFSENGPIFIPHYRDLWQYKSYPKGLKVVNIDNKPETIIKHILKASVVYASSLHGIIFSHALSKPCIFVAPQTKEPIFKYQDYFMSIGMEMPEPLAHISKLSYTKDVSTTLDYSIGLKDFYFPDNELLRSKNILS
ncbi:xanthan biosynthesis pyruvyltransferase GumL [Croceibacter atlanticus HTCC2559]|jgi:pyruvyltransferase|uniref:Xanthan biosynthesis pyruvyltransferase GumL n=2 Tax=Croceibacter TaxID=216431 RepID=A3U8H5_CROAH|nr:xanthan biosynthesis pyruvyltransferase GumL [Croceibacter atlanticus HTCC2559]